MQLTEKHLTTRTARQTESAHSTNKDTNIFVVAYGELYSHINRVFND